MSTIVVIIIFTSMAVISYLVWENDRTIWDMKESTEKSYHTVIDHFNDLRQDFIKNVAAQYSVNDTVNERIRVLADHQSYDEKENPEQNDRMKIIELALAEREKEISELKTELNNLKTVLAYKTVTFGG